MPDIDFYQGAYTGAQIDSAVGRALNPDSTPTDGHTDKLITSAGVKSAIDALDDKFIVIDSDYAVLNDLTWSAYSGVYFAPLTFSGSTTVSGYKPVSATIANFASWTEGSNLSTYISRSANTVSVRSDVNTFNSGSKVLIRVLFVKI